MKYILKFLVSIIEGALELAHIVVISAFVGMGFVFGGLVGLSMYASFIS